MDGQAVIARPRRGRSNPPPSERGRLTHLAAGLAGDAPRLGEWLRDTAAGSLACCVLGREGVRRRLRSTNAVERHHQEVWRRTRGILIFPKKASCQRLLTILSSEVNDPWRGQGWLIAPIFEREASPRRRNA